MTLNFIKMNGSGNDFVIIDARKNHVSLSTEQIRTLSSRDNVLTKGCDQLVILETLPSLPSPLMVEDKKADVFMRIYNADGGEVDACGNATRCIADMLYNELGRLPVTIQTNVAILHGVKKVDDYILVDMGEPKFGWQDIPLAMPIEEAAKKVTAFCGLENPYFVNMGNPHVVFFVDNFDILAHLDIDFIGSKLEQYTEVFPERVNVSFAALSAPYIETKVWERGAGLTKACGTGACAILAAANMNDKNIKNAPIIFINSNQSVFVKLTENGHILLGGAIETEFAGTVET